MKLCECGCGKSTTITGRTYNNEGVKKGEARRFIRWHHSKGKKNPNWTGGELRHKGYVYVYAPDHPRPTITRYVKRARLVMEKYIGRILESEEQIHHLNQIRDDDRIENLEIVSLSEHNSRHYPDKKEKMMAARWRKTC